MQRSGLLAFPLTPFDAVDRETLATHIAHQLDVRRRTGRLGELSPSAWFVACGTGEFAALSSAEYRTVVRTAVDTVAGQAPVFAGVGGGPGTARELVTVAHECGADGILLLPPYLVSSTPTGLVEHVRYVATGSPLPVIVYQRANAVLDVASTLALLDLPNVTGVKDGIGDIDTMAQIAAAVRTSGHRRAETFEFFNGLPTAELAAPAYRAIGIGGYSSAALSFAPDIALAYYESLVDGDTATRDALLKHFYLPLTQLRSTVPGYSVALVKAGARLAGLPMGPVRPPLVEPTPEHLELLERIVDGGRSVLRDLTPHPGTQVIG